MAVALLAVLLALWLLPGAATPAPADTDLTQQVLEARKAVGLPAVTENPAVLAAVVAVLGGADPKTVFSATGGVGDLITATMPAAEALSTDKMRVVVFDPRVTAIAVLGRGSTVAVAAALDPKRPFAAPVLTGTDVDPGVAGSIGLLYPPGSGTIPKITLQRYRGSQLVTIGTVATAVAGTEGSILVDLKGLDRVTGPQIGYGLTYTLKAGMTSLKVKTIPIPSVLVSSKAVAGPGFTGNDKKRFMSYVNALPGPAKKIANIIGGVVTISVLAKTTAICGAPTSCAGFDPGNGYFMMLNRAQLRSGQAKFIIDHELGHLVDFLGLDSFSHQDFTNLFKKSSNWKNCFPLNGQCTPSIEVFADQFAFYSTNAKGVQSGYNDPRLASSSGFKKTLDVQWAFRPPQDFNPLAGFGPLAKSFENAMHSGANNL